VRAGRSASAPRVLVAGGSLGGLTAAHVLAGAGCDVEVLERSPAPLTGRGAGIVLHPATVRWWLEHDVRALPEMSAAMRRLRYLAADGSVAHEQECRYRVSSFDALYRDLSGRLDPVRHRRGREVAGFEIDDGGVIVALGDGGTERCDLLVCADGIQSRARRVLCPNVAPRYAGYVAWRGTVVEHDLTAAAQDVLLGAIVYHLMPDSHFLAYPIPGADGSVRPGRRLTNWLWYRNVAEGDALDALMTDRAGIRRPVSLAPGAVAPERLTDLRASCATQLPLPLAELVGATPEPFVQVVFDIEVPRMAFGRACLIGDAAFALRPHAAVGSAKAAEDAWRLGAAMTASGFDVPAALDRWEPGQLALGRGALERTRRAGERAQHTGEWQVGEPLPWGLYAVGDSALD
jgi:2,6-dihydroxypyridine 3-monooxygenase